MKFTIAIEQGDENTAFGVVVPDLPGCFSAGDTLEEAFENSKEAISLWIEDALDNNEKIPETLPLENHIKNPEFKDYVFAVVDVDLNALSDKTERINITMPSRVLRRLDFLAQKAGETRSGFLAHKIMSSF